MDIGSMLINFVQILVWILESREHPSFRDDWHPWAEKEARGIRAALQWGGVEPAASTS